MPERDPYPMSSPEAQRLAKSVEGGLVAEGNATRNWHSMTTESAGPGPRGSSADEGTASEGLIHVASQKAAAGADIYAAAEALEKRDEKRTDEFLETPMTDSRGPKWEREIVSNLRFFERVYHKLYGDKIPLSEMIRTLTLASTLFFMIGGYWLLRSLKDPILTALCGVAAIPRAKMMSVFIVLAVVSIYNRMLDSDIPRHQLFYIFGSFYFVLFTIISFLLRHPTIGLPNEQPDQSRILGWVSYCSIESFGSVMVSLFWSFTNSNFSLETAKASYGVMVATAQVGSIIGPTVVNRFASRIGVARCYLVGALCMLMLQCTMYIYIAKYGVQERNAATPATPTSAVKKKEKAGVLEGLKLFWEHNYVKGIFAISCLFMVEVTIVDFTLKLLGRDYYADKFPCQQGMSCWNAKTGVHGMSAEATEAFTSFMGFFGQATNTLSFLLSFFGTSAVIRYLGLRTTLLLFPSLCLAVIIFVRLHPTLHVVFGAMIMLKACSYALNNPTKEMLYQPTSAAVRYKAKSWIDIFGARGSKALGSLVTNFFSDSATNLVANGSFVGMAVASFLIWNATFMGKKFDEYTETGYIVGGDNDENVRSYERAQQEDIQLAVAQNEKDDTSCAIDEDDDKLGAEEEGRKSEGGDEAGGEGGSDRQEKDPAVVMRV